MYQHIYINISQQNLNDLSLPTRVFSKNCKPSGKGILLIGFAALYHRILQKKNMASVTEFIVFFPLNLQFILTIIYIYILDFPRLKKAELTLQTITEFNSATPTNYPITSHK